MDDLVRQYEILKSTASQRALISLVEMMRRVGIADGIFAENPGTKGKRRTNKDGKGKAAGRR